jgi:hypothetical protein
MNPRLLIAMIDPLEFLVATMDAGAQPQRAREHPRHATGVTEEN